MPDVDLNAVCDLVERLSGLLIMAYRTNSRGVPHNVTLPRSWFINLIFPSVDFRKDRSAFVKFTSTVIELMHRIDAESRPQRSPTPTPDTEELGAEVQEDSTPAPDTEDQVKTEVHQDPAPAPETKEPDAEAHQKLAPAPDTKKLDSEARQDPAPVPDTKEPHVEAHQDPVPAPNTEEPDAEVQRDPISASDTEDQPTTDGDQATDFMGALYIARM
jgi:hypothetical protein